MVGGYMNSAPSAQPSVINNSAPYSGDTLRRQQNMGLEPRMPSPGSTLGRVTNFAQSPYAGAALARMSRVPGSAQSWAAPYADILESGMTPTLQANQMGAQAVRGATMQNDTYQQVSPFAPRMAEQEVRGATINNDAAAATVPYAGPQAGANVKRTEAEAGAITAGAGTTPQMVNQLQAEVRRLQAENQQHRTQLERYQQQEAAAGKQTATDTRAAEHEKNVNTRESQRINESARTRDMSRSTAMAGKIMEQQGDKVTPQGAMDQAYDALGLKGSPTTQPTPATAQGTQGHVQQQAGDQVHMGFVYRKGKDGNFYKIGPAGQ
jgi:hypothetical protein